MVDAEVTIVGGGAAGLMCAISAAGRGRRVILLEGTNRIGKKILMSGGGRCNFTNIHCNADAFVSNNPHFCKSALSRFTQWDFIAMVEKHDIAYHEKTLGQLFCDNSSKDIVAMLKQECDALGVAIETDCEDIAIEGDGPFIASSSRLSVRSDSLVVACGGLSIPRMGASDLGYRIARQYGLNVFDTSAALVPFTFSGDMHNRVERLAGVSCFASATSGETTFTEAILFTHRGLSGPAILQISSYWRPGETIAIDLFPEFDVTNWLLDMKQRQPRSLLRTPLSEKLPRALVIELQDLIWPKHAETRLADMKQAAIVDIAQQLHNWTLRPAATEGYRTAEVTIGGVDTDELSSQSMQARKRPGLYFVGEVVDVTGHLGGFNFQWAWASGWAAGQSV